VASQEGKELIPFHHVRGELYAERVPVSKIAEKVETPFYLYSLAALREAYRSLDGAFSEIQRTICFSVKANSNLSVLRAFALEGCGFDIVSGGELYRVLSAGGDPRKTVFSGVGKSAEEIRYALEQRILMFNVESSQELEEIDRVARTLRVKAPVGLRVNPDVDPKTHPYISTGLKKSKFGIEIQRSIAEYRRARSLPNLEVIGIDCHIGSQLTSVSPFVDALSRVRHLMKSLSSEGIAISFLDVGGGLGVTYHNEVPPTHQEYASALIGSLDGFRGHLLLEPGRALVANAGILVTRVLYLKQTETKRFVIVDGGMNDLIRPSLYGSYHAIRAVRKRNGETMIADLVGPICESGDFFAKDREIPNLERGDLVAVMSAGAYGFVMASNYNSKPKAAEVLVDGEDFHITRERETFEDLTRGESIPAILH
jgi:diaminopimelate decarboxylase